MTLRNKITFGSIIIILLSYIVVAVVVSIYMNRIFINQVQTRIRHDLFSAHKIYDDYVERIEQILLAVSIRRRMDAPLEKELEGDLGNVFKSIYINSGLDILTLVDMDGNVLYRAHNPGSKGDNVTNIQMIDKVLKQWTPVRGTVVFSAEMLEGEGKKISERASIQIMPTPKARPSSKKKEDRGMFIAAAVPFVSLNNNEKLGILLGGYLLNRNQEIVDNIREEVFQDLIYKQKDAGTATIFFDTMLFSLSIKLKY